MWSLEPLFSGILPPPQCLVGCSPAGRGRAAPHRRAGHSSWDYSATSNQMWVTPWQIAQQDHPGGSALRGPSPSTLPITQTRLLGNGEEGSDWRTDRVGGVREWGAYSLWSPHAPAHWCHGCGCGRAGVCSCALLQPLAPPQPPPSAQGRPAAWELYQRQLRSPSSWHCLPSTMAQGVASPGSLSPQVSTASSPQGMQTEAG